MRIIMDGITYNLRVVAGSLQEAFEIIEGPNSGTLLSGEAARDIVGTVYNHSLSVEPDPRYYEDYTAFYMAISSPAPSHTITLPHNQGTITYEAMVRSGSHSVRNSMGQVIRYTGLTVNFTAKAPQISAE